MNLEITVSETFGSYISRRRREIGISQKQLAALVLREEDGKPISPQYLNDIERDRRNPSSDSLIKQFASALNDDPDYLAYLAGIIRTEHRGLPKDQFEEAFSAFRRTTGR